MERLTEKVFGFVQLKACGNDFCKETCAEHDEEKSCKNCHIQKAFEKLAEYEDLEERLNGVSVKQVVDGFIKTVENQTNEEYEHGRILTNAEADKWNEYKQLEEQGLLMKLPCRSVYYIVDKGTKYATVMSKSIQDLCVFEIKGIGKDGYYWSTQEQAEQKLKEMESD